MNDMIRKAKVVAIAIREEIVRQYRDNDRAKCPAGVPFWEEEIQPMLLADVAIQAFQQEKSTNDVIRIARGIVSSGDNITYPSGASARYVREVMNKLIALVETGLGEKMNRKISFTKEGAIQVESESSIEIISRGIVLLTMKQAREAIKHGWEMDAASPFSKETTPFLYAVRKG